MAGLGICLPRRPHTTSPHQHQRPGKGPSLPQSLQVHDHRPRERDLRPALPSAIHKAHIHIHVRDRQYAIYFSYPRPGLPSLTPASAPARAAHPFRNSSTLIRPRFPLTPSAPVVYILLSAFLEVPTCAASWPAHDNAVTGLIISSSAGNCIYLAISIFIFSIQQKCWNR
ncbi:hypothetical protein K505DRAFT_104303 [Melanomma pulvis-pyrius CBS 109.77]|uniref:Uncharacterized protein n=1 Tax=Melanomma pulvis-pyrius CBS 109.77 TaxID=1314802 RepID=A0A6A6WYA2_9PLEO|nr:hypothetical protein K505DRAFT_104303 [Melanomma pulvis-pyrius CBS 109.77]